ncbi:hypothetical protein MKW92_012794 [Papaver armeniacum]|nr:hypothetical protein MKW92_012794 [Papaver armeniacum]
MTRVMISRTWNEVDFLGTNEVQSLDLLMIDLNLHGVVPKKFIWKFEPLLHEGVAYSLSKLNLAAEKKIFRPAKNDKRAFFEWNTEVQALDSTTVKIPRHKFSFTAFEELESCAANTYLTDVVGVLTSHTTLQEIKRANGQRSIMRDITLQNLSGVNVKITLWGDATSELSRNLDQHGIEPAPVIVVVTGCYVKKYLGFRVICLFTGKLTLSSTNSTEVYFNMELPEVVDMRQRCCRPTPPRQITLPTKRGASTPALLLFDNRKTISELLVAKWDVGCNEQNKIVCRVTANRLLTDGDWYYPGCSNCTTKLVGEEGDWWCTKCEAKIDEPIPRCFHRLWYRKHPIFPNMSYEF